MSEQTEAILTPQERRKQDEGDDAVFYAEPRFVQHLDAAFRRRLTALYRERLPDRTAADTLVLDLMSSWVSHLPDDIRYREVIGHGLNARELEANPRLDRRWVQNLNQDQRLPLETVSVDAALIVAGWQYLQQPEAVASELARVVRPGGQVIVAFSNRMFPTKAPVVWLEASDRERLTIVVRILAAAGFRVVQRIAEETRAEGPLAWLGGKGDPFFAVVAER